MRLTFLGHQGWMVESSDYRLLIDPIICAYFRNSRHSRNWMYPPRRLDLGRVGPVDGVYFSHEHEDHFHIESIDALDRETSVYLSGNMSFAAERILAEMGFMSVERLFAFEELTLGDQMSLTVFPPPAESSERWVLQPFIKGRSYRESFFNPVDCRVSPQFVNMLKDKKVDALGLVCMANNSQIPRHAGDPRSFRGQRRQAAMNFGPARALDGHLAFADLPGFRYLAIVGGGFVDETSDFGTFKCASQQRLADILQEYSHDQARVFGPLPGQYVDLGDERTVVHERDDDGVVVPSPEGEVALRAAERKAESYDVRRPYQPITGHRTITGDELSALDRCLAALASKLSASALQAELVQQAFGRQGDGSWLPFKEGRLAFLLLHDDAAEGHLWYEYQPFRQAFVRLTAGSTRTALDAYPFGFECWASDLLALCQGDLSIYEISKYHCREWWPEVTYHGRGTVSATLDHLFAPDVSGDITYALYRNALERLARPEPATASLAGASPLGLSTQVVVSPGAPEILHSDLLKRELGSVLGRNARVSVEAVGSRSMRRLNKASLNHDYATDVLAFDYGDTPQGHQVKIVVCPPVARREARTRGIPFEQEVCRYVVHGALHCNGHDDQAKQTRERMWREQERILKDVFGEQYAGSGE